MFSATFNHLLPNVLGPALGLMVGGAHLLPLHGAVLLQGPPNKCIVTMTTLLSLVSVTCTF